MEIGRQTAARRSPRRKPSPFLRFDSRSAQSRPVIFISQPHPLWLPCVFFKMTLDEGSQAEPMGQVFDGEFAILPADASHAFMLASDASYLTDSKRFGLFGELPFHFLGALDLTGLSPDVALVLSENSSRKLLNPFRGCLRTAQARRAM